MSSSSKRCKEFKVVPQFIHQHLPEVISHKEIEDGVDDTVQKGQRPSYNVERVDGNLSALGLLAALQARGDPHIPQDVVGSEKHGEDHNCRDD